MHTRDTAVRVRGVSRCAKNPNRTRTRVTHFGNTAGLAVPVLNPNYISHPRRKQPYLVIVTQLKGKTMVQVGA